MPNFLKQSQFDHVTHNYELPKELLWVLFRFTVVFVLICMILSTLATMSACLVIHIGKGYEHSNVRAPVRLRNAAILLSRLFRMTDDDPISRPELEKLDKRQHEWRFLAAMLDDCSSSVGSSSASSSIRTFGTSLILLTLQFYLV